ncbi:hypothetical protein ACFQGT_00300 [Natrialbaceae archaeon GCM10025810]
MSSEADALPQKRFKCHRCGEKTPHATRYHLAQCRRCGKVRSRARRTNAPEGDDAE